MATFTKQQLFQVRNEIDIDYLINHKLYLECQFKGGWRFRCPLCQQFNTATQQKNNSGRCFSCQQNFNTIDLTIYTKKINFVPAVQWLLLLLDNTPTVVVNEKEKAPNMTLPDNKIRVVNRSKGQQEIEKIKRILNSNLQIVSRLS